MKTVIFIVLGLLVMAIGGQLAVYFLFGVITLIGFIALVESIPPLKWIVVRTSSVLDIIIFIVTIMATASLGVTIMASLTIAGLGFTLLYAPYLRANHKKRKSNIKS